MNSIVGLTFFALGIVLLIFGFNESRSFGSEVSRFFTGNPTDRAIWLIIGGAVSIAGGLLLAWRGTRAR
jgi:hypothetical protein